MLMFLVRIREELKSEVTRGIYAENILNFRERTAFL